MKKIAIIGSPGAGKTKLTKDLGRILKLKVYHLDRLFWKWGWEEKDRDSRIDILQRLVQREQWIIEGTYLRSSELRLKMADTIIFLDTSPLVCLRRIIKRHCEEYGRYRRDIPEGCVDKLTLPRILKVLTFPLAERRKLKNKLREFPSEKVIWLHSAKEVKDFLAKPELYVQQRRQPTKTSSIFEEFFDMISAIFLRVFYPF